MNQNELLHTEKMKQLQKHFNKLKSIAIVLWIIANIIIDTLAIIFFSIEIILFTIIITLILTTMIMKNYLGRLKRVRMVQESELMEKTPLGRLKF